VTSSQLVTRPATGRAATRRPLPAPMSAERTGARPVDHVMRVVLLLFFACLPLQWYLVPGLPPGAQRVHVLAIILFTGFGLARYRAHVFVPVIRVALPVLVLLAVFVAVWIGTSLYHSMPLNSALQEAVQIVTLVVMGTVVYRAAAYPSTRVLEAARWAAAAAGVVLLLALSLSMLSNGINPAATFAQTIAQADPEVLQKQLFKSAFAGFGIGAEEVQGNIRHEVMGALLTAMCLSSAAARLRPFASPRAARLYRISMGLGAALLLVSMSRSVMLAASIWVVLAVVTQARRFGVTKRQLATVSVSLLVLLVLLVTGFASVIYVRFTQDTASYEGRDRLLGEAIATIPHHLWTGGIDPAGSSSHMFIFDSALRAGILGGLVAVTIVVLVVTLFLQLTRRLPTEPAWMLPVTATLALPMVRFFTAGGGLIPPGEYVALGIVAGFLTYRLSLSRNGR
jgi:hypothetical protein